MKCSSIFFLIFQFKEKEKNIKNKSNVNLKNPFYHNSFYWIFTKQKREGERGVTQNIQTSDFTEFIYTGKIIL